MKRGDKTYRRRSLEPKEVHKTLGQSILADGFDMVLDLKKSHGNYLYDSKNERWMLDMFSFFASNPIGMNHPAMQTEEFRTKLADVAVNKPTNSDIYTIELAEFVATFRDVAVPEGFPHLFFISGGALAVENALKVAFDWKVAKNLAKGLPEPKGCKVIHLEEAFHGRTGYTLSLTNTADMRKIMYFPKFAWPRITNPKVTFPLNEENLEKVVALEAKALGQLDEIIATEGDDIAALILEPIQGEGGDNHFRNEFFKAIRERTLENDILLVLDEIQSGLGITGKMWAYQNFDIEPDIVAFGKKSQVCGIFASRRIDDVDDNVFAISSRLNSTWGGNLVDMVRCQKYLEIIVTERLIENAVTVGKYLHNRLLELQDEFSERVTNVRGQGLMRAFDIKEEAREKMSPGTRFKDATCPVFRQRLLEKTYENGLLLLPCGKGGIRFRPTLTTSEKEVDKAMEILTKSIKQIS